MSLAFIVLLPAGPAAGDAGEVEARRIAGQHRYQTAGLIAATFAAEGGDPVDTVIIASGAVFVDAAAAGGFAGHRNAPILLTRPDELPPETEDALDDLDPGTVYLLGGTVRVWPPVEERLQELGYSVTRLWGANRFETAALLAREIGAEAIGRYGGLATAIIATVDAYPDSLASGPIAFTGVHPVLLTRRDVLPDAARSALVDLGIEQVLIVGGPAAVGPEVAEELEEITGRPPVRLFGSDRFATAVAVADEAIAHFGFAAAEVLLASGRVFPEALAGGPLGSVRGAPVLLTGSLPDATEAWLRDHAGTVTAVTAMGGVRAIPEETLEAARQAATAQEDP